MPSRSVAKSTLETCVAALGYFLLPSDERNLDAVASRRLHLQWWFGFIIFVQSCGHISSVVPSSFTMSQFQER